MAGKSRTAQYYAKNPEAAEKRREYQREYNKSSSAKKYRAECNAGRKALGLKKGDKRDASHCKSGRIVAENRTVNRARNGSNNKSTKK
jgi:hypothetical protein